MGVYAGDVSIQNPDHRTLTLLLALGVGRRVGLVRHTEPHRCRELAGIVKCEPVLKNWAHSHTHKGTHPGCLYNSDTCGNTQSHKELSVCMYVEQDKWMAGRIGGGKGLLPRSDSRGGHTPPIHRKLK